MLASLKFYKSKNANQLTNIMTHGITRNSFQISLSKLDMSDYMLKLEWRVNMYTN